MDSQYKQQTPSDLANEITGQILNYNHQEQVEIFDMVRKNLINERKMQNEVMVKAHEENASNINLHAEGTKFISSGL